LAGLEVAVSRLDVRVAHIQRVNETGARIDALQVLARNDGRPIELGGCVVQLPLGLRLYSGPPQLDYPFWLEAGAQCSDSFGYRELAARAKERGCRGKVSLVAMFLETGGFTSPATPMARFPGEHRSGSFVFDVERWL
jgi:hypothetical protein